MPRVLKAIQAGLLSSGVPILITQEHAVVAASQGALRLFATTEKELIGSSILNWMPIYQGDGKLSDAKFDEQRYEAGGPLKDYVEFKVKDSHGNLIDTEITFDAYRQDDEEFCFLFLHRSDQKNRALIQLKENEKLFRTLADNAPVLLKMANARNLYFYFSQRWLEFVGIPLEEAVNNHWIEYVHPEDLSQILTQLDQAYKKRRGFDFSYRLRRADGVYRNVQDVGVPYTDDKGFFLGYISSTIDKDEELIRQKVESADQFHHAIEETLDKAGFLAFSIDGQNHILNYNAFFRDVLGGDSDWIGRNWTSLFHISFDGITFQKGELPKPFPQNFYLRTCQDDMPERTFRCNTFYYLPEGDVRNYDFGSTIIGEDITDDLTHARQLRESNDQLFRSETKFRNIFENLQDVYFQIDLRGRIRLVSPSVKEVTGYEADYLIGRNVNELLIYSIRLKRALKALLKEKRAKNIEFQFVRTDGEVIDCLCSLSLFRDRANGNYGFEGTLRDITEIKQTNLQLQEAKETAERSLKVKEKFLANMSHEIRTPMNGIIGLVDLLLEEDLSPRNREFMETIKRSSATLLTILNDILDLSKIEAGKMQVKKNDFVLEESLEKVLTLFNQIAANKNIGLTYTIEPEVPTAIKTDETRLVQILSNLTSNAIKFTDKGTVSIRISVEGQVGDTFFLRFEITDTGIGISPDQVQQLFNQFNQLDNSLTKSYGGTGLGLVISRNLAQLLGGEMGVDSTPGEGSQFWFTIAAKAGKAIRTSTTEPEVDLSQPMAGKVLVVDDNNVNRRVALEILNTANIRPWQASNGQEAVDICEKEKFDLILMDIQMPVMDGISAMKEVKKGLNADSVIVALTAYSMKEDKAKFIKQGFSDYLSKPITKNSLLEIAAKYLGAPHPEQSLEATHAPEQVDTEIIDMQVFMELQSMIGYEGLMETYQDFIRESTELLKQIDDPEQSLSVAHTIKGSGGTLGLTRIYESAKKLEHAIREDNQHAIPALKGELFFHFDSFVTYFEAKLNPVNS